ncbi:DNA/RNA polymerase [Thozetella sp. PMI_491]|nr:DNA/RNA polymerase [Thozetella sp. PMI_491]
MLVRSRQSLPIRRLAALGSSISHGPSQSILTSNPRPWRRRPLRGRPVAFERNLATALDSIHAREGLPYDGLSGSLSGGIRAPVPPIYEMRDFEGFAPIQFADPVPLPGRKRVDNAGLPGHLIETIALYDACLKVSRLERAAMMLKRIASFNTLSAEDMMELHNRYLKEKVAHLQAEPGPDRAEDLHSWFELEIRAEMLPLTPETIAYMLKASFLTSRGKRLESLVQRYMDMLPDNAGLGELHLGDILSDHELSAITQICPSFSLAYDDMDYPELDEYLDEGDLASSTEVSTTGLKTAHSQTPDVLSTPQKGMGLRSIKRSLSLFDNVLDGDVIANLSASEQREIQSRLERDCVDAALERWREEHQALQTMGLNMAVSSGKLSPKLYEWHVALEARLDREFKLIDDSIASEAKTADDVDRCLYGPFIQQSSTRRLAAVTILSLLSCMGGVHGNDKGVTVSLAVTNLARVVEEDIRVQRKERQQAIKRADVRRTKLLRKHVPAASSQSEAPAHADQQPPPTTAPVTMDAFHGEGFGIKDLENRGYWPSSVKVKVGAALLTALTESARITAVKENPETGAKMSQSQPAFVHGIKLKKGKKVGMIMANPIIAELLREEPPAEYLARHLPMVVEPEPWRKWDKGGYIESPTPLVRVKYGEAEQRLYTQAALRRGDMDQVLKGMDVLGKTAWKINRPVFDVMLDVWNSGEGFDAIPALHPDIQYPSEPDASDDPSKRSSWIRMMKAADNEKCGLHSIRCNMNFQMEVAKAFRDQTFYFPHNVDFRGRAYPIPTYLNHMGADNVRGLLRFAKGKPLGENGLRWLKVHLANLHGFDKASLKDREAFAEKNLENVYDSALRPLTGKMWWRDAEDPWQCLAACFELKAALDSPDPTQFVSYLPVHQDGTCNGLQHYAALGGDTWGAKQVNLEPGDRPADVYSAVAQLVQEMISKEAAAGNAMALAMDGKIARKVVKQTVMTNVYGVTFAGAKKQILKQLDAIYPSLRDESGIEPMLLASYIARKVFAALSTMFNGAHEIQQWLGAIGGRVCRALTPEQLSTMAEQSASAEAEPRKKAGARGKKASATAKTIPADVLAQFRSTIIWTTPLRMPVVQPYRTSSALGISTCLQSLVLTQPDRSDPVNQRKQLQAFPPNFIHSLDASHMILSALECDARGLSFAAVHDSFWTHAADIDTMNEVLRDAFIRIHSDDVIGRLAEEFKTRHKGSLYLAKIPTSSNLGKRVAELRRSYATTMTLKEELLREHDRRCLLESSDPELKKKGEAMVTPASIFAEMQETEDLDAVLLADDAEAAEADELDVAESGASGEASPNAGAAAQDDPSAMPFGVFLAGKTKRTYSPGMEKIQVWLPLTFPPIPAKGDFDVRRLKESQYFFS